MSADSSALPLVALMALALACGEPSPPEASAPETVVEEPAPAEPAATAPPAPPPPSPAPPPGVAAPEPGAPAPPALDLAELERRLKQTKALGVMTKLALKNEIDDLIADVDAFHRGREGRLADLRERFELLLLKVTSLLQEKEPELASRIAAARESLWRLLADPVEFARLTA